MKYGYARVSTKGQSKNGNSLEEQVEKLKSEGCQVIYEESFTGTKAERPEFTKLLSELKVHDYLVVTKLDRFSRSASDAIRIIKELFKIGVKVHILNMGIVEDTPTGRLIFNILSAFSEFERDMIVERTQSGKELAKMKNADFKEGRPNKFTKLQLNTAMDLFDQGFSYNEVAGRTGISKSTLIRHRKKRGLIKKNI